jgi:uncharacterized protein (TIGR00730 family)
MGQADAPAVAVFGSYDPAGTGEGCQQAHAVGRVLAELGYAVVNGGYGGTMDASARGAVQAGGHTIGVTCDRWGRQANKHIRQVVPTADLAERLQHLADLASAGFVVLPGSTGTLLELAWVWEHIFKRMSPRRPIVCLGEFWRPLVELMARSRGGCGELVAMAGSVDDLAAHFPPRRGEQGLGPSKAVE